MQYYVEVTKKIEEVMTKETEKISLAADFVYQCIKEEGMIYLFGCGHSHLIALDVFYRAGGLGNVVPILDEPLMLHKSAEQSSVLEKQNGYASTFIQNYEFHKKDVLIIVSTSNINPVPIDVALYCKAKGMKLITISSSNYWDKQSKHNSHQSLHELGDINIDNHQPYGDAIIEMNNYPTPFLSGSTIVGITIVNSIFEIAIKKAIVKKVNLDLYLSGNRDNCQKHNEIIIKKFKNKIKNL